MQVKISAKRIPNRSVLTIHGHVHGKTPFFNRKWSPRSVGTRKLFICCCVKDVSISYIICNNAVFFYKANFLTLSFCKIWRGKNKSGALLYNVSDAGNRFDEVGTQLVSA